MICLLAPPSPIPTLPYFITIGIEIDMYPTSALFFFLQKSVFKGK